MANFKRGKRKSARAGCLFCKPFKHQCAKDSWESQTRQEKLALAAEAPERQWKQSPKVRKLWVIESREVCTPERAEWLNHTRKGTATFRARVYPWGTFRKYTSRRDRDNALATLRRREETLSAQSPHRLRVEYREGAEPESGRVS